MRLEFHKQVFSDISRITCEPSVPQHSLTEAVVIESGLKGKAEEFKQVGAEIYTKA